MNLSRWLINRKLLWLNLFHYAFRPAKEQILRTKTTESFVQESLTHFLTYNTALRRQTDKHTAKCLLLYSTLRIILIIIITNLLWNNLLCNFSCQISHKCGNILNFAVFSTMLQKCLVCQK